MHKNIPIFIPHLGCPHRCIFCDQKTISGHGAFRPAAVQDEIERALDTMDRGTLPQIAFFGGSFTAIDPALMHELLALAQTYVDAGRVAGIRFSTRPDAVGEDLLDSLAPYSVDAIELGLQSLDDAVLSIAQRGYRAATAEDSCQRIVARGYTLGGQMMVGLPGSTPETELETARRICALGAREARVYPTVVFAGTALGDMLLRGEYAPLSVQAAVERCAPVLAVFEQHGVRVLRVGLCESEGLHSERVLGGAHHPALGELIRSQQYLLRMRALLEENRPEKNASVCFSVAKGKCSQALGQHRCNAEQLCREFGLSRLTVREDAALCGTQITIT